MFAMKDVLLFPPKLFFNKNVNLESLYLICLLFPLETAANEFITYPNTVNDLLILHPSINLSPVDFVNFYLSLPAKSIKLKQLFLYDWQPSLFYIVYKCIVNIVCDLLD